MKNKITITGANKLFVLIISLFMVFQMVLLVLTSFFGKDFIENNMYPMLLVNQYVIILMPVLLYAKIANLDFKKVFRFNRPKLTHIGLVFCIAFPAFLAATMINTLVAYLLQFIGKLPPQTIPIPTNIKELIVGILVVAVTPGICEELLNRGIMLRAYENRGSIKAIVISSIFFGFFHFDISNLLGPIFLGLIIGYLVIRTNSIFVGMFAHFMNNFIAEVWSFLILKYGDSIGKTNENMLVPTQELISIFIVLIGCLFVLIILLKCFKHITRHYVRLKPPIADVRNDVLSIVTHWPIIIFIIMYFLISLLTILSMRMGL